MILPNPGKTKLVILDLDGTIIDSGPGIKSCLRKTMAEFHLPSPSEEELQAFVGPPMRDSFQTKCGLSPSQAEAALAVYRTAYIREGLFDGFIYEGIPALLQYLANHNITVALGTSKPWVLAHRVLRHFHLRHLVDRVFGCYRDGRLDSKAQVLESLLAHYYPPGCGSVAGDEVIMVGDRFYDVEGAMACGLATAGVTYGYGSKEELTKAGAAALLDHPMDLIRYL